MVFNTTFNNISVISWRLVLLLKESGVPVLFLNYNEKIKSRDADLSLFRPPFCFPVAADT